MTPKIIFLIILCMIATDLTAQERKNPCDKLYVIDASVSVGGSATGPTENIEVGLWGRKNTIGFSGGLMFYNGKTIINEKTKLSSIPLISEFYIRPTFKLDHNNIIEGFHHAITLFAGMKGNGGVSYRAYYEPGPNIMFGLEPYTSIKTGNGLNFLVTCAFN